MGIRGVVAVAMASAVLAGVAAAGGPAAARPRQDPELVECVAGPEPFGDVPGASLEAELHRSEDGVQYVLWRGTVPSFDGLPLSVDLTLPCGPEASSTDLPTVAMLHGFTDDKTIWEETGKSDTVMSEDRPGANSRWNNIWFASRGYATLTYTARGWHDSCGPDTPGWKGDEPPAQCADHEWWIHLDDKRWEVRDAQWLVAGLVSGGTSDPERLAITGGSYGGAPTSSAALLADQIMCGGAPVPEELGSDPCEGKDDGDLVPWTTRDGDTSLVWAAALPLYTFSDLLRVLAPNGRWSDGEVQVAPGGSTTEPFGVPLSSTVSGLILAGSVFGKFAPRGGDADSDVLTTTDRLLAGPPYDPDDPVVRQGIDGYEAYKSPITTEPQGEVPMFLVQGFTDALFPASEAIAMVDHLHATDPDYPVKAFFGDIGHDYAAERQDDWNLVKVQMNEFLDHYLDPERTPDAPAFDVSASVTRCLPVDAPQTVFVEERWSDLHGDPVTFTSDEGGTTSTTKAGPSGAASDPISTATLPGPDSYKGCRIVEPPETDPTTVTAEFDVDDEILMVGAPVVDLDVSTTGPDVPLAVRVWDVDVEGDAQALVTRGVHRMADAAPEATGVRFQLSPQAYRFTAGHRVKVEVTANDSPYLLANDEQATATIQRLAIELPERAAADQQPVDDGTTVLLAPEPDAGPAAWVLGLLVFGVVVLVVDTYFLVRVLRRRRAARAVGAGPREDDAPGAEAAGGTDVEPPDA